MSSTIISAEEFAARRNDSNAVVIDARSGPDAKSKFEASHIVNARFADLEMDLSSKADSPATGGRHPLPAVKHFARTLGNLGISPSSLVFVYDDKSGANAAARFWWMLRAVGHKHVWVIDGGFQAAQNAGVPVTPASPAFKALTAYPATSWLLPTVQLSDVIDASIKDNQTIVDVRETFRYNGEREAIDQVAGHIPSAINIPFSSNLDQNGLFLSAETLRKKYQDALHGRSLSETIVHCGSGVTACHTLLALEHAGLQGAKLYVGSWSEWSRNDLPIQTTT